MFSYGFVYSSPIQPFIEQQKKVAETVWSTIPDVCCMFIEIVRLVETINSRQFMCAHALFNYTISSVVFGFFSFLFVRRYCVHNKRQRI